ncbi:unnamed protein product, partial [Musa acuminata var. zebrina]
HIWTDQPFPPFLFVVNPNPHVPNSLSLSLSGLCTLYLVGSSALQLGAANSISPSFVLHPRRPDSSRAVETLAPPPSAPNFGRRSGGRWRRNWGSRRWSSPPLCDEPRRIPASPSRSWWSGPGRRRTSDPTPRKR